MLINTFLIYNIIPYFSVALVKFSSRPEDTILIVGIAKDLVLNPRSVTGGELLTYQVVIVNQYHCFASPVLF